MQKITDLCNWQAEFLKKMKRILAAVLAAASVLVSAGSPAVFDVSVEVAVSDSEAKDDEQASSGYWTISNEITIAQKVLGKQKWRADLLSDHPQLPDLRRDSFRGQTDRSILKSRKRQPSWNSKNHLVKNLFLDLKPVGYDH